MSPAAFAHISRILEQSFLESLRSLQIGCFLRDAHELLRNRAHPWGASETPYAFAKSDLDEIWRLIKY